MGRRPCCAKVGLNRGAWSAREDRILANYINVHGEGKWRELPQRAGLKRCGKSCRLRWMNYLRPDIKRGNISIEEEDLIIRLHALLGNRHSLSLLHNILLHSSTETWSLIAGRLPGRTDNEIKNYWNTNLRKRLYGQNPTSAAGDESSEKSYNFVDAVTVTGEDDSPSPIRTKAVRCTTRIAAAAIPEVDITPPYFCKGDGVDGDGDRDFFMPAGVNIDDDYYSGFHLDIDISDLLLSDGGEFFEQTDSGSAHGGAGLPLTEEETTAMEKWGEGDEVGMELQCLSSFLNSETKWID